MEPPLHKTIAAIDYIVRLIRILYTSTTWNTKRRNYVINIRDELTEIRPAHR